MKTRERVRWRWFFAVVASFVLALTACGSDNGSTTAVEQATQEDTVQDQVTQQEQAGGEPVTVRIVTAVDKYYGYMPVIAHETLGTFDGLDVNIEVISGTTPTLGQILAGGEADLALGFAPAIVGFAESGVPVELVAKVLGPWGSYMIVSSEGDYAGATSIEDLKGANFGITGAGSPGNYVMAQYAEELGWSEDDYRETALGDVGSLFAALTGGSVDALIWAADQAYAMEAQGVATYFALPDRRPNVLQAFGINTEFAEEHPDLVKDVLDAYFAKVEELQENPDPFIDVLVEEWGIDRAIAESLAENQLPDLDTEGLITDEELDGVADTVPFISGRPGSEPPNIEEYYTPWPDL
jgi:ABC-type nitrate/sulfonate/bicarbonate transport system substrate-binding protein